MVWVRTGGAALKQVLTDDGLAQDGPGQWAHHGRNWMLTATLDPVEDEDIPDEVYATLRGITHQVALHVMPGTAPRAAITRAGQLARRLAEAGQGLWQDLQTDALKIATTARPAPRPKPSSRRVTVLSLDWAMDHSAVMSRDGIGALLDVLQRHLPEALPRRYGPWEPPKFTYADTGRAHFIDTYLADPQMAIYATRPAFGLSLPAFPAGVRMISGRGKYWAATVSVQLDASLLDDATMAAHLPKAFAAISACLRPFYGEARCLSGYEAGSNGPLRLLTREFRGSPVSPWWQGVPPDPGIACVIGAPYLALWPGRAGWDERDGLALRNPPVWTAQPLDIALPPDIAQPRHPGAPTAENYKEVMAYESGRARVFPFGRDNPG